MKPPDLQAVFGTPKSGPAPGMDEESPPEEGTEGDGADMDDALDTAIDEVFASKDPEARREAFKNAIRMCKEADAGPVGGGGY